jgi:tripartite-type tricarboxylate transporter receptor subunit TctC
MHRKTSVRPHSSSIKDHTTLKLALICVSTLLAPAWLTLAQAAYPDKPIKLVVPWAPGGSTDALARALGQQMATTLGQEVLVDNRPGAAGAVGTGTVAKAPADGYTITIIELPHALAPAVVARLPYDLKRDFVPISLIGTSALMLFTNPNVPAHSSVRGWLADAKDKAGALALAHSGVGAVSHLAGEVLQARAGVKLNQVPYRGSAPALTDVAGGQVSAHFATLASASALVSAGRVKPIAVASAKRLPVMPDVPTLAEQGVSGMVIEQWWGLVAPAGTPPAITERLRAELHAALGHPSVRERLRVLAIEKQPSTSAEFARFIDSEMQRWAVVARDAGLKPE